MALSAGHSLAVHIASSDTTGETTGLKSFDWDVSADLIDTTDTADTTGMHIRGLLGLKDATGNGTWDYNPSDTAQALVISSWASGATVYIRYLPGGSTGVKGVFKVENYKLTGGVDGGAMQLTATFRGTGALGTV